MQVISCSAYEIPVRDKETTRDRNKTDKTERCTFIGEEHNIYRFLRKGTFLSKIKQIFKQSIQNNDMNDLSFLRAPYNQKNISSINENRHTVTMPFVWWKDVFCKLRSNFYNTKKKKLADMQRM